ncbi:MULTISPECIES: 2-amino-4-hydroxy-6-hydroxymethyldihydropteridine diphosphokinase [Thiorhodovibrio]|uniref:2-amino-4-hydroxy-6- hydroxymethyldihydropteridine diphosphokinase n=1 Tax=Thiorhodovibrio TaxID=61593 RepID=UPI001914B35E|nr:MULTISPECIES: 2-amino-4-hydroxy-6-hydroxymethyldihydropteridine diphosphokinase [Thiorhodovibrio]MBK5968006.1 2-amino-4-hydroxy-6-hydroxymethyldihydropteridine diphosphokinase [Thiorhodovibrio winogradskyi]WPL11823.1 2-amino-4-hydroxy-6-hydroxymethyldihydropteridine pyrophosphokinase [Thiorhodovibrio litoralis]
MRKPLVEPAGPLFERTAYVAIGSNIDALRNVRRCLALLRALPGVSLEAVSSLYRTKAWGGATEAEFINLAVALRTALSARELLARTQRIELALGRERAERHGARTIDLDLLLIGEETHQNEQLRVPHPGLLERDFMLLPLLEIAPELRHPQTGVPLAHQRGEIPYRQIIERVP